MSNSLIKLLRCLLLVSIIYILASFNAVTFNIANWSENERITSVILMGFGIFIIVMNTEE